MELIIYSIQIIHIIVCILLIIVVLLQPGKGGDLGSVFGGGGGTSESVFGAAGAVPFLAKVTRVLAVLFLLSSLTLGYFAAKNVGSSVVTDMPASEQITDIVPPEEVAEPQAPAEDAAPAEVSQDGGETAPEATEPQMSSGSETEANQEPATDTNQETQQ